jgi:hypothetical protein
MSTTELESDQQIGVVPTIGRAPAAQVAGPTSTATKP